mmetsp:Transcript_39384/g.88067  ORF Transcript_39384/g.88067 Transcript_39384/m.88067 type:complete len:235 (+) Transcript_39384:406-1110(+)
MLPDLHEAHGGGGDASRVHDQDTSLHRHGGHVGRSEGVQVSCGARRGRERGAAAAPATEKNAREEEGKGRQRHILSQLRHDGQGGAFGGAVRLPWPRAHLVPADRRQAPEEPIVDGHGDANFVDRFEPDGPLPRALPSRRHFENRLLERRGHGVVVRGAPRRRLHDRRGLLPGLHLGLPHLDAGQGKARGGSAAAGGRAFSGGPKTQGQEEDRGLLVPWARGLSAWFDAARPDA